MLSHDDPHFYMDGHPKPVYEIVDLDLPTEQKNSMILNYFYSLTDTRNILTSNPLESLITYILETGVSIDISKLTENNRSNIVSTYVRKNFGDPSIVTYDAEFKEHGDYKMAFEKSLLNHLILNALT